MDSHAHSLATRSASGRLPFAGQPWLASRDLDEVATLLSSQVEKRSLQPGRRGQADIRFNMQAMPQLKLFGADWGLEIGVRSLPLANWHAILPLQGGVSSRPDGQSAAAGELLVFTPGHEVDVVWHEGTQAVVIALDAACLVDHVKRHHRSEVTRVPAQAQLIDRQHPALVSLGNLLGLVDREAGSPSGLLATLIGQQHLQHLFCENLLHLIPSLSTLPQRSLLPGTVKRVVDFIHAHLDQPLCISQLVAVSATSSAAGWMRSASCCCATSRASCSCPSWPSAGVSPSPAISPRPTSRPSASRRRRPWPAGPESGRASPAALSVLVPRKRDTPRGGPRGVSCVLPGVT